MSQSTKYLPKITECEMTPEPSVYSHTEYVQLFERLIASEKRATSLSTVLGWIDSQARLSPLEKKIYQENKTKF